MPKKLNASNSNFPSLEEGLNRSKGVVPPLESVEQGRFVGFVRSNHPEILCFAIPNGGSRDPREGAKLKREGVLSGVPDIFIPEPRKGFHGLYIEFKRDVLKGVRGDGDLSSGGGAAGKTKAKMEREDFLSPNQKIVVDKLRERGYKVEIAYGCNDGYIKFLKYFDLDEDLRIFLKTL